MATSARGFPDTRRTRLQFLHSGVDLSAMNPPNFDSFSSNCNSIDYRTGNPPITSPNFEPESTSCQPKSGPEGHFHGQPYKGQRTVKMLLVFLECSLFNQTNASLLRLQSVLDCVSTPITLRWIGQSLAEICQPN